MTSQYSRCFKILIHVITMNKTWHYTTMKELICDVTVCEYCASQACAYAHVASHRCLLLANIALEVHRLATKCQQFLRFISICVRDTIYMALQLKFLPPLLCHYFSHVYGIFLWLSTYIYTLYIVTTGLVLWWFHLYVHDNNIYKNNNIVCACDIGSEKRGHYINQPRVIGIIRSKNTNLTRE